MFRFLLLVVLTCTPLRAQVYRIADDPTRYVLRHGCGLAILPEGPLRARCSAIPFYEKELTLEPPTRPATLAALAAALDIAEPDLPPDVRALWQSGHAPSASAFHRVPRGYLEVCSYMPHFARLRRYPAAAPAVEIRPWSGLPELVRLPGIRLEDIGEHLLRVDAGQAVDWSDPTGY